MHEGKERYIEKVKIIRGFDREQVNEGIIVKTSDNVGLLYKRDTGKVYIARKDKNNNWHFSHHSMNQGGTTKYVYVVFPRTGNDTKKGYQVGAHVLGTIALGLWDNIPEDKIELYNVNHKNWNVLDNSEGNIEVCTVEQNFEHKRLHKILLSLGVENSKFSAKVAKGILDSIKEAIYNYKYTDDGLADMI